MSDLQSDAEEIEAGIFNGKSPKHGEFDVVNAVLKTPTFVNASLAEWEMALQKASDQAVPGRHPRITHI